MRRHGALAAALVLVLALAPAAAQDLDGGLDLRALSADQQRRLLQGEVIAFRVPEASERELTVGLVMHVAAPLVRVTEYVARGDLLLQDTTIAEHGTMMALGAAAGPAAGAPGGARLAGDPDEARELLESAPGGRFNLGASELEAFRTLRGRLAGTSREGVQGAVASQYRALLVQRAQAYERAGLGGIEAYVRRTGPALDPGADLRGGAADARLAAALVPGAPGLLERDPARGALASQLVWVRRQIQGKTAVIVVHQWTHARPDAVLHVERHVYVGHSYNWSQTVVGAVTSPQGAFVISTARVSTDQVAGMGGEVKRAMGRRQVRGEFTRRMERLRAAVQQPRGPESP